MKKLLFLLFISPIITFGQPVPPRNSIQLGVDYLKLDSPDALGAHPTIRYARHFANDRIVVAATGGFFTRLQSNSLTGHTRIRLTADLSVLADLLRSQRHALRLGGGPSAWYRYDDLFTSARFLQNPTTGETNTVSQRSQVTAIDLGWHLTSEYAYAVMSDFTVTGRIMVANLGAGGVSPMAGLGLSFHF